MKPVRLIESLGELKRCFISNINSCVDVAYTSERVNTQLGHPPNAKSLYCAVYVHILLCNWLTIWYQSEVNGTFIFLIF